MILKHNLTEPDYYTREGGYGNCNTGLTCISPPVSGAFNLIAVLCHVLCVHSVNVVMAGNQVQV